jgi:hypothetical protein
MHCLHLSPEGGGNMYTETLVFTSPHGFTAQKINIDSFTALGTSNLTFLKTVFLLQHVKQHCGHATTAFSLKCDGDK